MARNVVPVSFGAVTGWRRRFEDLGVPDVAKVPDEPLVSCLCVTENRHAFMPWLLWNYDRQAWKRRELIVVDSSEPAIELPERSDVRVIRTPLGTSLGRKRNMALEAASGEVVAWFDDDDWQHPERLSQLVPLLRSYAQSMGASYIGPSQSWFLNLYNDGCEPYRMNDYAIFNGAVFYTDMVRHERFPEEVLQTEDTRWISALLRTRQGAALAGSQPILFFWLSHDANVTNRRSTRRLGVEAQKLRRSVGAAWGDTSLQLEELRSRLADRPATRPARVLWSERAAAPAENSTALTFEAALAARRNTAASREAPAGRPRAVSYPSAGSAGSATSSSTVFGRKLRVYSIGHVRGAAAGFLPHVSRSARYPLTDALVGIALRRRAEWEDADYTGFVSATLIERGVVFERLAHELQGQGFRHDVYGYAEERRRAAATLLDPAELRVAAHVLVRRMRLPASALSRELPAVTPLGWIARPDLFKRFVHDWLVPARRVLEDRFDLELRRLLLEADPGGRGNVGERILALLAAAFLGGERAKIRVVDVPRPVDDAVAGASNV